MAYMYITFAWAARKRMSYFFFVWFIMQTLQTQTQRYRKQKKTQRCTQTTWAWSNEISLSLSGVELVQLLELEYSRTHLQLYNPCCMLTFTATHMVHKILNNYEVVVYREFFA